jgi:4-amino-4-deoxy-L-arabinose transferase-like glycosyltransferase
MGIAIGSKYNALIAWFIMNMFLMFSFSRDTHRQVAAVTYGILFFGISLCIASPWYVKNYFQTGNPFYPLFNSIFQSLQHGSLKEAVNNRLIEKTGSIGFFKMREIMYGEGLVETLLIPIRMFFQGQDNSYQYFQGSLNPILIVFLPFILLSKKYKPDKLFFVFFSVIFIFMAYFLTEKQVRYILPTIPFFAILAVMGIKNLADKLREKTLYFSARSARNITSISRIVIFTSVAVFLIFNLLYLKNRISIIKPFAYVLGQETEGAFLKRHLLHYDAVRYINDNLPVDARIFTLFLGRRGYYLDRAYKNEPSFGMDTLNQLVNSSTNPENFVEHLRSMNVTHILMRTDLVDNHLKNNFSKKEIERFVVLAKKNWKLLYEDNGYAVWALRTESK